MASNQQKNMDDAELTVSELGAPKIVGISCLKVGTEIMMANGSTNKIENICEGDFVLTFDHEVGAFVGNKVIYTYKGDSPKCAFTLNFENGTTLSIVGEHDLFEQESNKYVSISCENVKKFIGKHFYSVDKKGYVKLLGVTYETKEADYYELYTEKAINMVANGMLNVADDVNYLLNIYDFNADLSANKKTLKNDVEEYGLFDFSESLNVTKQEFDAWNMKYIYVFVGKGLISADVLCHQHFFAYLGQNNARKNCECA